MAYLKTDYINEMEPAINEDNLNKSENAIGNSTLWKEASAISDANYELVIDNWETKINSYLAVYFNDAVDNLQDVTIKINDENSIYLVDSEGNNVKGFAIENKMILLRFNGIKFEVFSPKEESINFDEIYPVGTVYLSVVNTNPGLLFGGTWSLLCPGRTLVCVDTAQTEFNTVKKTGGHKNLQQHNHSFSGTTNSTGAHTHTLANVWLNKSGDAYVPKSGSYYANGQTGTTNSTGAHTHTISGTTGNQGSGNAQNLQPYMACYMWERTE